MAVHHTSNVKMSSPITVAARPDADFNGFMFSREIGFMFPATAASVASEPPPAPLPAPNSVGAMGRSRQR